MAASKNVDQIIAACPSTFTDLEDMSEWFGSTYRWGEIEQYPEVKEASWIALATIESLDKRQQYRETILAQLNAIKNITVTNTTPTT